MLDRIESAVRQLHTITDSLAHDIRSPITTVRGRLEASLNSPSPERQSDAIVSSIEVLDRLSEFLTESLDVAEANADALRLTLGEMDLESALASMVDLYQASMVDKNLTVDFERRSPVIIMADAALIHRMITNLFDNELVHIPAGSKIKIDLQESETAILTIQDDGPGFPPEMLNNVFERHTKGTASTGYGLGLAFVDAVVHAHGGRVSASNSNSGGAQIRIELPLHKGSLLIRESHHGSR
jgi:signal transduction histidine kinase